jgi:hypothetical protein
MKYSLTYRKGHNPSVSCNCLPVQVVVFSVKILICRKRTICQTSDSHENHGAISMCFFHLIVGDPVLILTDASCGMDVMYNSRNEEWFTPEKTKKYRLKVTDDEGEKIQVEDPTHECQI